jgi:cell volume regulation protein A
MVIASAILHGTSIPFVARILGLAAPLPKESRFGMELDPDKTGNSELIELVIPAGSPAAGKQIVNTGLPAGTLIILVARGDDQFSPRGATVIEEGDSLLILTLPEHAGVVRTIFLGPEGTSAEPALDIPEWWFTWGKK